VGKAPIASWWRVQLQASSSEGLGHGHQPGDGDQKVEGIGEAQCS
jgi:hypothetical protein